jgi:hypothetical protein
MTTTNILQDFHAGMYAASTGQHDHARACFLRVLDADPRHEAALLWLSYVAPSTDLALLCLQQLLAINPRHDYAQQAYTALQAEMISSVLSNNTAPDTPPQPSRLGERLIAAGLLSYRQLETALAEQALRRWKKQPARLGEILIDLRMIDRPTLDALLQTPQQQAEPDQPPWPLGEYLLQAGTITLAQLNAALRLQTQWRAYGRQALLGDVLVALNFVTQDDLDRIVTHWQERYRIVAQPAEDLVTT